MNIVDAKAIFGMIGTSITAVITWVQTTFYFPDWIPIIPAIATAIYMIIKAHDIYKSGKLRRAQERAQWKADQHKREERNE